MEIVITQKTIKEEIVFSGIGVHSGVQCSVTLKPAEHDHGIVICSAHNPEKRFLLGSVIPVVAMHATVINSNGWMVSTVEHLLAAIMGLGIDNLIIEVDGPEVPILDGSSLPFVQEIMSRGITLQSSQKTFLTPQSVLKFEDGKGRILEITPAQKNEDGSFDTNLHVEYEADFSSALIKDPVIAGNVTTVFFCDDIAPARTFGFLEQLPFLRQHGLAQGSSLGNTVVIGEGEFVNKLRFSNECVRHKFLDLIGDLGLLGKSLCGTVKAKKTGHSFNRKVVEHFVNHPSDWLLI